jgi:hypothetical protein
MRLNYLGIFCALSLTSAFAQISGPEVRLGRRQHVQIRDRVDHFDGTATSSNWSGYAVTGTGFTSASASWVVPAAVCTGVSNRSDEYASFWVGLDGYSSNSVEQVGTDSDCNGSNPSYYAWYEFYPQPSYNILSVPVSPGNVISASVVYSATGNDFTVTLTNVSTGKSYSKTSTVRGAERTSAEWITEAPCCSGRSGILPLADFGTINFGADYTNVSGTNYAVSSTVSGPISAFSTAVDISKTASKTSPQLSTCSVLSADGTSFNCTWAQ